MTWKLYPNKEDTVTITIVSRGASLSVECHNEDPQTLRRAATLLNGKAKALARQA